MVFVLAAYVLGVLLALDCLAEVVWDGPQSMTGEEIAAALILSAIWPICFAALIVGLVVREVRK